MMGEPFSYFVRLWIERNNKTFREVESYWEKVWDLVYIISLFGLPCLKLYVITP